MNNDKTLFFTGIDWGSQSHQVCLVDQRGRILGQKAFKHSGQGLCDMAEWILQTCGSGTGNVAVGIEINHGPVVETLLERGFEVYSINPKQLDRFRDRFSPSGAKDDRRDALVLADALRTDTRHFRRINPQDPDVAQLRELSHTREELKGDHTRLVNRMRGLLLSYYPQLSEVIGDSLKPWLCELWELAPTPAAARRIRPSTVKKLLKRHRIRRIDAEGVIKILRSKEIALDEAVVRSRAAHVKSIVERIKLIDRQLEETEKLIDDTIGNIEKKDPEKRKDIEILRSVPGVGTVVLGILLTEACDLLSRRDYRSLRCLGGTAPVTRQSGKSKYVSRRRAVSRRLQGALYHWTRVAAQRDPVSREKYKALRARGLGHARSLRTVGDRLLRVTCSLLEKGELFDEKFKELPEAAAA